MSIDAPTPPTDPDATAEAGSPARDLRQHLKSAGNLTFTVAIALFFALAIQAFAVKPYRIPSESMVPTLLVGDHVLVDRFSHRALGAKPRIGDIVVFHPSHGVDFDQTRCGSPRTGIGSQSPCETPMTTQSSQTFIKRVVAVGGDTVAIRDGHVIRNGRLQTEPFTAACAPGAGCNLPRAITVPPGHVFLMGDNRGNSDDSRFWGPIPTSWVIGRAFAEYWPVGRVGGL